jgi:threonine/homoserine/homoserine lactone efflux protein
VVAIISGISLTIWSAAGRLFTRFLRTPRRRVGFDRLLAAALMLSAVGLIRFQLETLK